MGGFSGLLRRGTAGRVGQGKRMAATGILLAGVCMSFATGSAWAASGIKLCVPKKEGSAILTPKHGACRKGYKLAGLGVEGKEGKHGAEGKAGAEGKQGLEGKAGFTAAQAEQLRSLLPYVKFVASGPNGRPTIQFSGINVQVLNGTGSTLTPNGLGNVIIGYDENEFSKGQTGSHDLVLGEQQTFTSVAGIVAGETNTISGEYATVTGGGGNVASGVDSSVSGGVGNTAAGESSSVTGGNSNKALGLVASVNGGSQNQVNGADASVAGGELNKANGPFDAILGGFEQTLASNSKCGTIPAGGVLC